MGEGGRRRRSRGVWKLRNAASKVAVAAVYACGWRKPLLHPLPTHSIPNSTSLSSSTKEISSGELREETACSITTKINENDFPNKNLCAICLDPLSYNNSKGSSPGQAIFTAQCSHAFHFACISSNVRHGNVTCPMCRAYWTQLPRNLCGSITCINQRDPILQILDESIATFRVHRHTLLHSTRYDDDDPVEPDDAPDTLKLYFSLVPIPPNSSASYSLSLHPLSCSSFSGPYLSLKLGQEKATDLVLVAIPNGPHLRLLKQSMALVVFSLRHIDRLAIVTYSSAAARVFPLRRMTNYGKRTALQAIDRLFYMGQADPLEGLKKGVKILEDRTHKNPKSCIFHLSDNPVPTRPYHTSINMELLSTPIHRFHVGFGFDTSNGFVIQEFQGFLGKMLGGIVRDIQLRICGTGGEEVGSGGVIRIEEMRGGEEKRVQLELGNSTLVYVEYSYTEGDIECVRRTGEIVVGLAALKAGIFMTLTWPEDGPSTCKDVTLTLLRPKLKDDLPTLKYHFR
ncbi:hypothetical protein RJT34_29611 [Clitoria ternatea]|uniref:RING-type domain-containing protein n=1 Tax=Clitoria ternatea TaxID=43366 RepID=A0AAN9ET64_CLITE